MARILKDEFKIPLSTGAAAVFPYSVDVASHWVTTGKFDNEPVILYRVIGTGDDRKLLLPREMFKTGTIDNRVDGQPVQFNCTFKARNSEQQRVYDESKALLLSGKSFIIQSPTGSGKSVVSCALVAAVGRKAMVIVDNEKIRDQWIAAAKMVLGLKDDEIGIVQGDLCQTVGRKFIIGMIQSLSKPGRYQPGAFTDIGFVITDEVQIIGAESFSNTVWMFPAKLRLGCSATPFRADGKDIVFYCHIGRVAVKAEQLQLVPKIFIKESAWKVPLVYRGGKMMRLPHTAGKMMAISKALGRDDGRNEIICKFVKAAYDKGRKIIVFSDLREHLLKLSSLLMRAGVKSQDMDMYVGGLTKEQRTKAEGKRVLLATYGFAHKGTDIPTLDCLVLGTPRSNVVQIVGRVLRESPDKKGPVVLDIVDRDSPVLVGYAGKRMSFYKRIGAEVSHV